MAGTRGAQKLVGAIDQGTSSTRFMLFDEAGRVVQSAQREFEQIYPRAGEQWVEHDPEVIWETVVECMAAVADDGGWTAADVAAIGVTNQRETTVVWDAESGAPLHNAVVWLDTRAAGLCDRLVAERGGGDRDVLRDLCGLPMNPYFSAPKLRWLLDNSDAVRRAAERGSLLFGTVDSWLIYRLTGGAAHVTDVTNASRTMLMNLAERRWSPRALRFFGIPDGVRLPRICSSSEVYGEVAARGAGPFAGVRVAGCVGDQQAAMLGQFCLRPGSAKNTYGTGCFMLMNTGASPVRSRHGLLTTAAFQLGPSRPVQYALEGSVAIAGAAVKWMRDRAGLVAGAAETEALARSVPDSGGVYFVTAFSGLFAPHWRTDARGLVAGLTLESTRAHIVRAALEAVCFRTREVIEAMRLDSGRDVLALRVDGGMSSNAFVMQFQADVCGCEVVRPANTETTAFGAAVAAGLAVGVWASPEAAEAACSASVKRFAPRMPPDERRRRLGFWNKAVERSLGWAEAKGEPAGRDAGASHGGGAAAAAQSSWRSVLATSLLAAAAAAAAGWLVGRSLQPSSPPTPPQP